jgi:hypothetical protein
VPLVHADLDDKLPFLTEISRRSCARWPASTLRNLPAFFRGALAPGWLKNATKSASRRQVSPSHRPSQRRIRSVSVGDCK